MSVKVLETASYIVIGMAVLVILFTLVMLGAFLEKRLKEKKATDDLMAYSPDELREEVLQEREESAQMRKTNVELLEALNESQAETLRWEQKYYDLSRGSKKE